MTTLCLVDYTPSSAQVGNVVPMHTTRVAKERGIAVAITLMMDRYDIPGTVADGILDRAMHTYRTTARSPAWVIADARAECSAWTHKES